MRIFVLLSLLIVLGGCSKPSLEDSIVGKVITLETKEKGQVQMTFNANGVLVGDLGLTYQLKGNEVLVFEDGERNGGMLFPSSSPKAGDQVEVEADGDKQKVTIIKIGNAVQNPLKDKVQQRELPNLDDAATRERVLAEAVDVDKLQKRIGNKPDVLNGVFYLPNQQEPYTGWAKTSVFVGQFLLWQIKDGKDHGRTVSWYESGQKETEGNSKDGKWHGVFRSWNEDGKLTREAIYKDGVLISEKRF
ncbi:MAG: hypothetical protein GY899_09815 [Verrucomicrobiaceae bacterium]|nr:hypothetical protein [Verrucomicrobiaceae bacterium]